MFTLEEFVCAESVYKLTTSRSVCSSQCTRALTGTKVRTSIGQVKRWLFTLVFFSLISGASATKEASTEETVQCWLLYIYLYIYIYIFLLLEGCLYLLQQQMANAQWLSELCSTAVSQSCLGSLDHAQRMHLQSMRIVSIARAQLAAQTYCEMMRELQHWLWKRWESMMRVSVMKSLQQTSTRSSTMPKNTRMLWQFVKTMQKTQKNKTLKTITHTLPKRGHN